MLCMPDKLAFELRESPVSILCVTIGAPVSAVVSVVWPCVGLEELISYVAGPLPAEPSPQSQCLYSYLHY